ncbi:MAG: hypothetical protein EOP49_15430 [Sphingobacteriales bacterium]|nr:MAG: hypothetical protein EOP49_15430 [Sphingobacteriales bacterium]
MKNNFAVSFNPKNLVGKISQKEFGSTRKLTAFNNLLGSTGRMYMKSTGIKDNIIAAEMVADVPENQENAMKYFLSLVEQASKID